MYVRKDGRFEGRMLLLLGGGVEEERGVMREGGNFKDMGLGVLPGSGRKRD